MTLGQRIQKARKEAGLFQEELAEQLGVSRQLSADGRMIMVIRRWKKSFG